ncbi:MAG TPA: nitronate monooxygenase [Solirubrobacteraceae bacterium]|jgi:nitronate monooxygenase|nr:nitronate monooxygenase [Solirubrobacteraceae bacterium]
MPLLEPGSLRIPIVQAPMAGGPSTPALAAAVGEAGGLGFLAAGYKTVEGLAADMAALRAATRAPFAVNLFAAPARPAVAASVGAYAATLSGEAERYGVALGEPRFDDDGYAAKLALLVHDPVAVVSFTFGAPSPADLAALHAAGSAVWVTVTDLPEAAVAESAGADALVVQGTEAGGHRGYFDDARPHEEFGLIALLRLLAARTRLPLVGAGGLADAASVAATLRAGASAAQLGTALMLTPEAGTTAAHREQIAGDLPTRLTRAFSGRTARGIVNRFMDEHDADAPCAYPEVNHLTAPLRAAARAREDAGGFNLWAGQAHALARARPAAELVQQFARY